MNEIERRIVAAHIVSNDNKVLFGRKLPGTGAVYENCWHIPGGGVDEGETDDQAIIREVKEETGLDVSNAKITLIDNRAYGESLKTTASGEKILVKMQFNIYKIEIDAPASQIKVQELDDLVGFKWFDVKQLNEIELTPPAYKLFERLGNHWLQYGVSI